MVSKKTSSVPVNDLIDAQEPKRVAFDRWKASQRERRLFKKTVKKKKKNSTKLKCCRQKRPWLSMNIPPQYKKNSLSSPPIEIYRPFEDPYRVFKAQIRCTGVLTLSDLILSTMQCASSY